MNPLDRETIKELRKIRNKTKREKKNADKLHDRHEKLLHEKNDKFESHQISIVSQEVLEKNKTMLKKPDRVFTLKKVESPKLSDYMRVTAAKKNKNVKVDEDDKIDNHFRGKQREIIKEKPKSRLRKDLNYSMQLNNCSLHEHELFNYCDNSISDEINLLCTSFIKRVVDLQEKNFKRDRTKAVLKKRYVTGFHELKKYMVINFIKLIIITRDIKVLHINDPLHKSINDIIEMAVVNNIPYIFALNRNLLGKLTLKFRPIGCFGVLDYDGANTEFISLMEEVVKVKPELSNREFRIHEDISDLFIKLQSTLK